ncbi:hypothetical protein ABK040_016895 [Willaertia magna]
MSLHCTLSFSELQPLFQFLQQNTPLDLNEILDIFNSSTEELSINNNYLFLDENILQQFTKEMFYYFLENSEEMIENKEMIKENLIFKLFKVMPLQLKNCFLFFLFKLNFNNQSKYFTIKHLNYFLQNYNLNINMIDSDYKTMVYYALYNADLCQDDFVKSLIYIGGISLTFYKAVKDEEENEETYKLIEIRLQNVPTKKMFGCGNAHMYFMKFRREMIVRAKNCKSYLLLNEQVTWRDIVMKKEQENYCKNLWHLIVMNNYYNNANDDWVNDNKCVTFCDLNIKFN